MSRVNKVTVRPSSVRTDIVMVDVSNNTARDRPVNRCTVPAGAVTTGGDCAAEAGVMTAGSAGLPASSPDEQPDTAPVTTVMTAVNAAAVPLIPRMARTGR